MISKITKITSKTYIKSKGAEAPLPYAKQCPQPYHKGASYRFNRQWITFSNHYQMIIFIYYYCDKIFKKKYMHLKNTKATTVEGA